jgi:hypothetical protein
MALLPDDPTHTLHRCAPKRLSQSFTVPTGGNRMGFTESEIRQKHSRVCQPNRPRLCLSRPADETRDQAFCRAQPVIELGVVGLR